MEKIYREVNGELVEIAERDPARLYRYTTVLGARAYVELTPAEEAARLAEQSAPRFDPANWYWIVTGQTGVYHSGRYAYVPLADATYVAFLAAGGAAYRAISDNYLRGLLNSQGIGYLAEAIPPVEAPRPTVLAARCRIQRASFSVANNAITAIEYITAGQDPLDMHNHSGPNPDRVVIPLGHGGTYALLAAFRFLESSAGAGGTPNAGDRVGGIRRGASESLAATRVRASTADNTEFQVYDEVVLAPGDIIRAGAFQNCGGSMNVASRFTLRRIE